MWVWNLTSHDRSLKNWERRHNFQLHIWFYCSLREKNYKSFYLTTIRWNLSFSDFSTQTDWRWHLGASSCDDTELTMTVSAAPSDNYNQFLFILQNNPHLGQKWTSKLQTFSCLKKCSCQILITWLIRFKTCLFLFYSSTKILLDIFLQNRFYMKL